MRLAEQCGMLHDVDGLLQSMTPERMDEVQAYDNVHGIGLTRLVEVVARGFTMLLDGMSEHGEGAPAIREMLDPWFKE